MTLSRNPGSYEDVRRILDAAQRNGGGVYRLKDGPKATTWCHRAYRYRGILQKLKAEELKETPGIAPSTPYDMMILKRDVNDPALVIILFERELGELYDLDGNPIDIDAGKHGDDLQSEAEAFAASLTIDEE